MGNNANGLRLLRWIALISGSLVLAFVAFMLGADLIGAMQEGRSWGHMDVSDTLQFLLFPIGLLVGLVLAYKWEMLGGAVTVMSMLTLCLLSTDLFRHAFYLWALPGMLYMIHAWLMSKTSRVG